MEVVVSFGIDFGRDLLGCGECARALCVGGRSVADQRRVCAQRGEWGCMHFCHSRFFLHHRREHRQNFN